MVSNPFYHDMQISWPDSGSPPIRLSDSWLSQCQKPCIFQHQPRSNFIAQVYRMSAVHCQVTRSSQRVPGYSTTRCSQCQPVKSPLTKNGQLDCLFQLILGLEEHYSPSPLADFNRLFEGLIGVLFKLWHIDMIYFLNGINPAQKVKIWMIDLLVKASWMQCPLHNQKVNKPGFHGASCQLTPSNIWTHKVQYLTTAVYW